MYTEFDKWVLSGGQRPPRYERAVGSVRVYTTIHGIDPKIFDALRGFLEVETHSLPTGQKWYVINVPAEGSSITLISDDLKDDDLKKDYIKEEANDDNPAT